MVDDISDNINRFLAVTEEAARVLHQLPEDVREALVASYHLEDQFPLLDMNLSAQRIIDDLAGFDFSKPILLATIELEESVIPDGVPIRFVEAVIKNRNEIWLIHKFDQDPFPSNPHGHNQENGLKLHLGTGGLYRKRKHVGKVHKKDLLAIRAKLVSI